jgi:hypothetical protein
MRIFDLAELEATIARNPGRKTTTLWDTLAVEAPAEHELQRRFLPALPPSRSGWRMVTRQEAQLARALKARTFGTI